MRIAEAADICDRKDAGPLRHIKQQLKKQLFKASKGQKEGPGMEGGKNVLNASLLATAGWIFLYQPEANSLSITQLASWTTWRQELCLSAPMVHFVQFLMLCLCVYMGTLPEDQDRCERELGLSHVVQLLIVESWTRKLSYTRRKAPPFLVSEQHLNKL